MEEGSRGPGEVQRLHAKRARADNDRGEQAGQHRAAASNGGDVGVWLSADVVGRATSRRRWAAHLGCSCLSRKCHYHAACVWFSSAASCCGPFMRSLHVVCVCEGVSEDSNSEVEDESGLLGPSLKFTPDPLQNALKFLPQLPVPLRQARLAEAEAA